VFVVGSLRVPGFLSCWVASVRLFVGLRDVVLARCPWFKVLPPGLVLLVGWHNISCVCGLLFVGGPVVVLPLVWLVGWLIGCSLQPLTSLGSLFVVCASVGVGVCRVSVVVGWLAWLAWLFGWLFGFRARRGSDELQNPLAALRKGRQRGPVVCWLVCCVGC
jgi:hypothetical protein